MKVGVDRLIDTAWLLAVSGMMIVLATQRPANEEQDTEQHFAGATTATAADIDIIGRAIFTWLSDQAGVAQRGIEPPSTCIATRTYDVTAIPTIGHAELEALLVPAYLPSLPAVDGWGHSYEFRLAADSIFLQDIAAVRSPGANGVFEGTVYVGGETSGPDDDQVWANGLFLRLRPNRHDTARQAQALVQLRSVGTAWISWLIDNQSLAPPKNGPSRGGSTIDLSALPTITHAELVEMLMPSSQPDFFYTQCIPERDPWGHLYEFRMNPDFLATTVLTMRSPGSDGVFEGDTYTVGAYDADDFTRDTVWADGVLAQFPDGEPDQRFADDFESGSDWGTWTCTLSP